MNSREIAASLRAWALEEGFDRAGIARLELSENADAFDGWLARGAHAGMSYLERRRAARLDPRQILTGGKTVLCVAMRYYPLARQQEPTGDLWPAVARYARGEDYHRFMEKGLLRLAARVQEAFPDIGIKSYVDTGPVLEREVAARAGLGCVGKNTNLLDAEIGSWFLLGELFLGLDLEPDTPAADLCGTCSLCLEACPAGALPEPYRLDSRLCISYWTIEHRGAIPREIRPGLGEWVFGCDVCQEVCPINTGLEPVDHAEFEIPGRRQDLSLAAIVEMGPEQYLEAFRHSPMKRAKLEGLQRNAVVAMGNSGRRQFQAPLIHALGSDSSLVRQHAAWALAKIGGEEGLAALRSALGLETDPEVRSEIENALAGAG